MSQIQVRLVLDSRTGELVSVNPRLIMSSAGQDRRVRTLPTESQVASVLNQTVYDQALWNQSTLGHRIDSSMVAIIGDTLTPEQASFV